MSPNESAPNLHALDLHALAQAKRLEARPVVYFGGGRATPLSPDRTAGLLTRAVDRVRGAFTGVDYAGQRTAQAAEAKKQADEAKAKRDALDARVFSPAEQIVNKESTGAHDELGFSIELLGEYGSFMKQYIYNLNQLRHFDATGARRVPPPADFTGTAIDNNRHQHDVELVKLFGTQGTDGEYQFDEKRWREWMIEGSPPANGSTSTEKTLHPERGRLLALVDRAMVHQTALKSFALGLHQELRPGGDRQINAVRIPGIDILRNPNSTPLVIDRGILRRIFQDTIKPAWERALLSRGGRPNALDEKEMAMAWQAATVRLSAVGVAAIISVVTANPVALLTAGSLALVARAVQSFHDGVKLEQRYCGAVFEAINQDANETAFVRQMAGIDVQDYIHTGNEFRLDPARVKYGTIDREGTEQQLIQNIMTRIKFHEQAGIDFKNLDALPYQFIYKGQRSGEQIATRAEGIIQREYTSWRNTPSGATASMTEQIAKYSQIESKYILDECRSIRALRRIEAEQQTITLDSATKITARALPTVDAATQVTDWATAGAEVIRRTATQTADIARNRLTVTHLQTAETTLQLLADLPETVAHRKAATNLTARMTRFGVPAGQTQHTADALIVLYNYLGNVANVMTGATNITGIGEFNIGGRGAGTQGLEYAKAARIAAANTDIANNKTAAIYGGTNTIATLEGNLNSAQGTLTTHKNNLATAIALRTGFEARMTAAVRRPGGLNPVEIAAFNAERTKLEKAITAATAPIAAAETAAKNADTTLATAKALLKTNEDILTAQRDRDIAEFDRIKALVSTEITELQSLINDEEAARRANEAAVRSNADVRTAQAREALFRSNYDMLIRIGVLPTDLQTQTIAQIMTQVNGLGHPEAWPVAQNNLPLRRNQVTDAIVEARSSLHTPPSRLTALRQLSNETTHAIQVQEANRTTIAADVHAEVGFLTVASSVLTRRAALNDGASELHDTQVTLPNFHSNPPNPSQGYTPDEVAFRDVFGGGLVVNRGYYELLNLVTGYQAESNRQQAFARAATALPPTGPNSMLELFNQHMYTANGLRVVADLNALLIDLQSRSSGQLRTALDQISRNIISRARALP